MAGRVLGDNSFLGFIYLASLRTHLLRQPLLTILTMLVVALSVALVVALGLSSQSVQQALMRSAKALRGAADLEITAGAVGIPERLLAEVSGSPSVAAAAPMIEAVVRVVGGPGDGRPLRVIGVDLLADQAVRSYTTIQRDLRVLDPLKLVAKSDSVIVSQVLAEPLGLSDGDTLTVRSTTGEHRLVVRGVLAAGGMGDAYAGQIVVMDVYALQALLDREGWLDRIDVVLRPNLTVEEATHELAAKVEGIATVRRPDPGNQFLGAAISTLALTATIIALAGTVVAGLLCYAALSASVDRRTRLFALLRAAGLEAKRIHHLVYVDSVAVAVAGVALGIPLGSWLSNLFSAVFSEASSFLSGRRVEPASMSVPMLLLGFGVGVGVSVVGAALAARRSTRLPPNEAIAGGRGELAPAPADVRFFRTSWLAIILLAAWVLTASVTLPVPGVWRIVLVFSLGMALLWVALAPLVGVILSSGRIGFERLIPGIGRVVSGSLRMRLNQTRIAVASIAALVAVISSLWILATSVFDTVDRASASNGGSLVAASAFAEGRSLNPLTEATVQAVSTTPGVEAVFEHYVSATIFRGENVRLSAISADVWGDRVGFELIDRNESDENLVRSLRSGDVLVYDAFQRRFGLGAGDTVRLDTSQGPADFKIAGVRRAYSVSSTGGIQMDLATFDRHWPRSGISNLIIWTTGNEQEVLNSVQKGAGAVQPLFIVPSEALERSMRSSLDIYRVPILSLIGLVVALAGAAVANLMAASALERRADIALLECLGASQRQLLGLVLLESSTLGAIGAIAGLVLGFACARTLSELVTERLGWVIARSTQPAELLLLALGTISASALIGVLTGMSARRGTTWNSLAPE